jgi:hypothetical protein
MALQTKTARRQDSDTLTTDLTGTLCEKERG